MIRDGHRILIVIRARIRILVIIGFRPILGFCLVGIFRRVGGWATTTPAHTPPPAFGARFCWTSPPEVSELSDLNLLLVLVVGESGIEAGFRALGCVLPSCLPPEPIEDYFLDEDLALGDSLWEV